MGKILLDVIHELRGLLDVKDSYLLGFLQDFRSTDCFAFDSVYPRTEFLDVLLVGVQVSVLVLVLSYGDLVDVHTV